MAKGRRSKSTGAKKEDVIECILEHDGTPDDLAGLEFKVHWLGSSADEDEWHYYEALKDMPVLQSYIAQHPDLSALGKKKRAKTEWTMVGDALSQTEVDEYLQGHVRKPQDTRYKVLINAFLKKG